MNILALVKFALNSTLGTDGFKALDRILIEQTDAYFFEKSENVIKTKQVNLTSNDIADNEQTFAVDFVPIYPGEVNLSFSTTLNMSSISAIDVSYTIVDGTDIKTGTITLPNATDGEFETANIPLSVLPNTRYKMYLTWSGSSGQAEYFVFNSLNIKATKNVAVNII